MQRRQDTAVSLSGTKAEALKRLRPLVSKSRILPQYDFSVAQWQERPDESLAAIRRQFAPQLVIVRSSARNEDSWRESKAGAFTSVSDIDPRDHRELRRAIERVLASYDTRD